MVTFKKEIKFDPENFTITVPGLQGKSVTIGVFDKVTVNITVEKDKNTQRGKVKMHLLKPVQSLDM